MTSPRWPSKVPTQQLHRDGSDSPGVGEEELSDWLEIELTVLGDEGKGGIIERSHCFMVPLSDPVSKCASLTFTHRTRLG